jgi:hypothetical protein
LTDAADFFLGAAITSDHLYARDGNDVINRLLKKSLVFADEA